MSSSEPAPRVEPREELQRMSLLEHLEDLRIRIVRSLLGVAVAFAVCWAFAEEIFAFLGRPIYRYLPSGRRLAFLNVTEPFFLYFKVALVAAIFLASPYLIYQAWAFVAPGLYRRERRYVVPFILVGSLFFLAGGAFGYYVAFPFAVEFLLGMGAGLELEPVISVGRFFRTEMLILLGLGMMFELPIFIFLLAVLGIVTPRFLMRHFRWAVLLIFVVAAIITPTPDVLNLCLFAVPTIALYLLGVGAAAMVVRMKRKKKEREEIET